MKTWKIPVCWTMMGTVNVEADTLEEAIEIARDDEGIIPIPYNGSFLDGSWEVDCTDVDYLRKYYNGNQMDNSTMTEEMYKELKRKVFDSGVNAIEGLLGCELEFDTDEDMSRAMDDVLYQMPEEDAMEFYNKYCR